MRNRGLVVLTVLAFVVLAACGGGGDDDADASASGPSETTDTTAADEDEDEDEDASEGEVSEEEYVDAVVASIVADGSPIDAEVAQCMGEAVVGVAGVDALNEAGISAADFGEADSYAGAGVEVPDDAAEQLTRALSDCDIGEAMASAIASELGDDFSPDAQACLTVAYASDETLAAFAASFIDGSDDAIEALVASSFGACPAAIVDVFLGGAASGGATITAEARECVTEYVDAHLDDAVAIFSSSSGEGDAFSEGLVLACPSLLG